MAANLRAEKVGFAKQAAERMAAKFDGEEAAKTLNWIRQLPAPDNLPSQFMGAIEKIPQDVKSVDMDQYADYLSNGLVFGYLMACIKPDRINQLKTANTWKVSPAAAFETTRQRERIGLFLQFLSEIGVPTTSQFQTDQLYEKTGLVQVVIALNHLAMVLKK
ncbi:Myophilin [Fasciolopsis buskii]|uniref:Myophilin n=1 Tax=Fasciolopsis buskii TaxID=27845 RepID=A0A8E0RVD1_9TREM|nr:Myophilin [Fasciolopsis buski]